MSTHFNTISLPSSSLSFVTIIIIFFMIIIIVVPTIIMLIFLMTTIHYCICLSLLPIDFIIFIVIGWLASNLMKHGPVRWLDAMLGRHTLVQGKSSTEVYQQQYLPGNICWENGNSTVNTFPIIIIIFPFITVCNSIRIHHWDHRGSSIRIHRRNTIHLYIVTVRNGIQYHIAGNIHLIRCRVRDSAGSAGLSRRS